MMDVSIIIVNYNTRQLTAECIDSVFEKTKNIEFEVILVDNASTDGSKEFFEKDSRIKYVYSDINLGFGKANNLGYKYSSGRYVFLLNSDTLLVNNAVKILSAFLYSHPDVAIVGGQLFDLGMKPVHSYYLFYPSLRWELNILFYSIYSKISERIKRRGLGKNDGFRVAYITGADMMLRKSDIDELGMFDPDFFMYFEESDLAYRYRKKNRISTFVPSAEIIHLENASFKVSINREDMFFKSRALFYSKHHSKFIHMVADFLYALTSLSRKCFCVVFNNRELLEYWTSRYNAFKKYSVWKRHKLE